jgi:hypothetical protein
MSDKIRELEKKLTFINLLTLFLLLTAAASVVAIGVHRADRCSEMGGIMSNGKCVKDTIKELK